MRNQYCSYSDLRRGFQMYMKDLVHNAMHIEILGKNNVLATKNSFATVVGYGQ